MIAVSQPTTAAELLANAAAVRKRLMSPLTAPKLTAEAKPALRLVKFEHPRRPPIRRKKIVYAKPSWKRMDNHFDAHVIDTRVERGDVHLSPVAFLRKRCIFHAVDYAEIIGKSQKRKFIVPARDTLILEVKLAYPHLSLPQIGRIFGGRDHTTIIHSLRKLGIEAGAIRGATAMKGDEIKSLWEEGKTQQEIAAALELTQSAVSRYIKKQGWTR